MKGRVQGCQIKEEELLFPQKLRLSLFADFHDVIEWLDDGSGFRICNKSNFVDCLIPTYFHMKKFLSFTRQLNVYGFRRIPDPDAKKGSKFCFFHPYFLRDHSDLMHLVKRRPPTFSRGKKPSELTISVPTEAEECSEEISQSPSSTQSSISSSRSVSNFFFSVPEDYPIIVQSVQENEEMLMDAIELLQDIFEKENLFEDPIGI